MAELAAAELVETPIDDFEDGSKVSAARLTPGYRDKVTPR
jgi:hypothetical protein